jgi:hypothetical protein
MLVLGDMPDQIGGDGLGIRPELVDELRVPEMVEISGLESVSGNLLVATASVVVVRAV